MQLLFKNKNDTFTTLFQYSIFFLKGCKYIIYLKKESLKKRCLNFEGNLFPQTTVTLMGASALPYEPHWLINILFEKANKWEGNFQKKYALPYGELIW